MHKSAQTPETIGNDINQQNFAIAQWVFRNVHTAIPCRVKEVRPIKPGEEKDGADGEIKGSVDVELLIDNQDNEGKKVETAVHYNLPYFRYQRGTCAFVVDPKKDDIGFALFCERDISKFKRQPKEKCLPDSYRKFSHSDGLYLGGILQDEPKIYVHLDCDKGIIVESDDKNLKVHIGGETEAEHEKKVEIKCGDDVTIEIEGDTKIDVKGDSEITCEGDVTWKVKGNFTLDVSKNLNLKATQAINISGSPVNIN